MGRPYISAVENENPVNVVWHDDERIKVRKREMSGDFMPAGGDNLTPFVQPHLIPNNLPEHAFLPIAANGDEVRAFLPVIIAAQPNGLPVMIFAVIRQDALLLEWLTVPPATIYHVTPGGRGTIYRAP